MPKIVCISDTHTLHNKLVIPDGDILVHSGDFTNVGEAHDIVAFGDWLRTLPHKHKIVIAGNHDWMFQLEPERAQALLGDGIIYLQDSGVEVMGLKFYGSPWQPFFCNWAFNLRFSHQLKEKWDLIPEGLDVLITHGPPYGILDPVVEYGAIKRTGCQDLLDAVERTKPRVHVFGHIHEGYGQLNRNDTLYINASSCTRAYRPTNDPITIDLGVK